MGDLREQMKKIKANLYNRLIVVNDRAFSMITIFILSFTIAHLESAYHLIAKITDFWYVLVALVALVLSTLLSATLARASKLFRTISAFLCLFLWTLITMLSGSLHSSEITKAIYYAILFWSNINLLGVFLNVGGKR